MKWISVEDELPDDSEDVLVWVIYETGDETFMKSWWDEEIQEWYMGRVRNFKVTHWMRIEKPS